jgi:hypothetical protein
MPPRKAKQIPTKQTVKETPVVLFLKVPECVDDEISPIGETTTYSDILNSVECGSTTNRFNNDLLKPILEKIQREQSYSEQVHCFWCCHQFNCRSFVLPISYDSYKNIYNCEGNFCSPECALAYNYSDNQISDGTRWNRHAMLYHLYSTLYTEDRPLSPAPPRDILRIFGGPLDIEQYRSYIEDENDLIVSELPPIRVLFPSMNVQGPLRDVKKYVSLSRDTVEKASEQLRLKRLKPMNVNVPTLDMCINSPR